MSKISADHHYIPKAVFRHFCFREETLWYFSRNAEYKGVHERNIGKVFKKRHLNTYVHDDGKKDDSLEIWFAKEFDDEIANTLKRIKAGLVNGYEWSQQYPINRQFIVQFIYNHMKRTPDLYRGVDMEQKLRETTETKLAELGPELGPEASDLTFEDIFPPDERARHAKNVLVQTLARQSDRVLNALWNLKLVFAVPMAGRSSFVIGSSPVVRLTNNGNDHLESGDVELWTSLTPLIAVGLVKKGDEGRVYRLNPLQVRTTNQQVVSNSSSVAARSDKLLRSLLNLR